MTPQPPRRKRPIALAWLAVFAMLVGRGAVVPIGQSNRVQFVFTSDAHYGITRSAFRGAVNVDAHVVNAAMIARINGLSGLSFPRDGGLGAGQSVGPLDFLVEAGDIANREEVVDTRPIQTATASWRQFQADYIDGLTVTDQAGHKAPLYVVPGNHDASNAVGFYRAMSPPIDKTVMAEIFNRMMAPRTLKTTSTYDYDRDKVLFARNHGGIHFLFLTVWPDSRARTWMESDLAHVSSSTPVVVFAHDQPEADAKHFRNPNRKHDVNDTDRFENLLSDELADGTTINASTVIEQAAFETFLTRHPNVTAYFHGNSNWNQFYDWIGPGHGVVLHTFRVDSPMKGAFSSNDETKLSFQIVTIDTTTRLMTVRECLWNANPRNPMAPLAWGGSTTVALQPRPASHS
jgi:hypothetical protein